MSRQLRDVALPFLQDISATTGENAHLAVRNGTSALYIERISGRSSVPIVSRSGSRLTLLATGVGKVLLAHAPDEVVAEEMTLGTSSLAVPVAGDDGAVFAALGVVVPSTRRDLARLAPVLEVAARGIARVTG